MLALEHSPVVQAVANGGYVFGDYDLGLATAERNAFVNKLLAELDRLTPGDLTEILEQFSRSEREEIIAALIAGGADPLKINDATRNLALDRDVRRQHRARAIWWLLALVSGSASAFHGYRRNQSVGWAIWWFFAGSVIPAITVPIAIAQGFGRGKYQRKPA